MGLMANEAGQKLMVTIQEYQALKGMELKSYLMELVKIACTETKDREKNFIKIRLLIKNFKFVMRTIYPEIL